MVEYFCRGLLKIQYHVRWFKSKAAALVLLWCLLTATAHRLLYLMLLVLDGTQRVSFAVVGTAAFALIAAPFFGWLADAKLGNYRVVKIGITISFSASVLVSLFSLLTYNTSLNSDRHMAARKAMVIGISLFFWAGTIIILVSSFQLSMEQMPDASAENITSLVSWFGFSTAAGFWAGDVIHDILFACLPYKPSDVYQILALFSVIFVSINFISFNLLSPKWLIIEPKSPQFLKNIYRVLKFAAKHKAPLNRSALTYWEEDIPSRIDLGKSRYGGPFTTEQVEDVKTFFRLLVVSVGIFLTTVASGIHEYTYFSTEVFQNVSNFNMCEVHSLFLFTFHPAWCAVLTVLVYEFLVYPCLNFRLPSSMKKIAIISFAVLLRNVVFLIVSILVYFHKVEKGAPWMKASNSVLYGVLTLNTLIPSLEFVCAQAPYNMRGLLSGYLQLNFWIAYLAGNVPSSSFNDYCQGPSCSLINTSVGAGLGIAAFLLYMITACWYKKRVRDDIDHPHKWVEDVYDRYLSAVDYQNPYRH